MSRNSLQSAKTVSSYFSLMFLVVLLVACGKDPQPLKPEPTSRIQMISQLGLSTDGEKRILIDLLSGKWELVSLVGNHKPSIITLDLKEEKFFRKNGAFYPFQKYNMRTNDNTIFSQKAGSVAYMQIAAGRLDLTFNVDPGDGLGETGLDFFAKAGPEENTIQLTDLASGEVEAVMKRLK